MRKIFMMMMMLAVAVGIEAQTKYHDVEANDAKGAVKTMTSNTVGQEQTINFSQDGKMEQKSTTDIVYDADGYIKSAKVEVRGQQMEVKYTWENGRVKSQSMEMMGQPMTVTHKYNEKGENTADEINVAGQSMETAYTDYKYDAKGNWISRKTSIMGQQMEQKRSFEYYE
jgi:ABC-type uncharacterized transport system YnjBCD substrate-binding protein